MRRWIRQVWCAVMMVCAAAPALAYDYLVPTHYAVYFSADWCPNCKALSPVLTQARVEGKLDTQSVLFVTLDLTNPATIRQSMLLAQALGLEEYMKSQGSATGYVALLAADKKTELARFDRESSKDDILAAFKKQLMPQAPSAPHP